MAVLGVDPGSRITGYGLVEKQGTILVCLEAGDVRPPAKAPFHERIHHIFRAMLEIIRRSSPRELAMEDMFHAKNVQSSLKLGHARGAVIIAAAECGVPLFEYSPSEVKRAVAGYGRASKEQVSAMVRRILNLQQDLTLDASDALAAAICHINWVRYRGEGGPISKRP